MNISRYLPAAGLFGLALYNLSQSDYAAAVHNALAGLALLGVHLAEAQSARRLNMVEDLANHTADLTADNNTRLARIVELDPVDGFRRFRAVEDEADSSGSSE